MHVIFPEYIYIYNFAFIFGSLLIWGKVALQFVCLYIEYMKILMGLHGAHISY